MCGRYALRSMPKRTARVFEAQVIARMADLLPRYNIAPTTPVPVVRLANVGRVIELIR